MDIKISLIIPVYNVEKYIRKCIESILNQTFKDFELIIINDGSIDNTGKICDEYSRLDSRIRVIHSYNMGQSAARNIGIQHSKGEYIGFIDGDDFIDKNMYEQLYYKCINEKADMGIIGLREVDENNLCLNEYIPMNVDLIEIMQRAYPCNKLIKRTLLLENNLNFTVGRYYEDVELITKVFLKSTQISKVNKVAYNYLKRRGSTTNNRDNKILDNLWAYKSIKAYLVDENLYNIYKDDFNKCIKNFKKYYCNILYDYPTFFLIKNLKRIIMDFNEIEKISFREYVYFINKHTIFSVKSQLYKIKVKIEAIFNI